MHTIEYDGAAPNPDAPWKITTDDGAEWHAGSEAEAEAAVELAEFIIERAQSLPGPGLPEGAVLI